MSRSAQKNMDITIRCITLLRDFGYDVYPHSRGGKEYDKLEMKSGEKFWDVGVHSTDEPKKTSLVGSPAVVGVYNGTVQYVVEIRCGHVDGEKKTDLSHLVSGKEATVFKKMVEKGQSVNIKGPLVEDGKESKGSLNLTYGTVPDTRFLIVADLKGAGENFPDDFEKARTALARFGDKVILLDHDAGYRDIVGLEKYLIDEAANEYLNKIGGGFGAKIIAKK